MIKPAKVEQTILATFEMKSKKEGGEGNVEKEKRCSQEGVLSKAAD